MSGKELQEYKEYVRTLKEYIELLGEELNELIGSAHAHGWCSSRVEAGKKLRDRIEKHEDKLR